MTSQQKNIQILLTGLKTSEDLTLSITENTFDAKTNYYSLRNLKDWWQKNREQSEIDLRV